MELVPPPAVTGYAIICDEIRQEMSGKLLFIGVYQDVMYLLGAFPTTLSRLAFQIVTSQDAKTFVPTMDLKIFLPGDDEDKASIEGKIGEDVEGAMKRAAVENSDRLGVPASERSRIVSTAIIGFEGVTMKEPGYIRVCVDIAGKRYRLAKLRVDKAPPQPSPHAA